jgi:hypothetical protein
MADVYYDLVAGRLYVCCIVVKQLLQYGCKIHDLMFHRRFVCVTTLLLFGYVHVTIELPLGSHSNEYSKGI